MLRASCPIKGLVGLSMAPEIVRPFLCVPPELGGVAAGLKSGWRVLISGYGRCCSGGVGSPV